MFIRLNVIDVGYMFINFEHITAVLEYAGKTRVRIIGEDADLIVEESVNTVVRLCSDEYLAKKSRAGV